MATIKLKENDVNTVGEIPAVGSQASDFSFVKADLSEANLTSFSGKKVLNIFPSIDTGTCANSVRAFNQKAAALEGVTVINVSKDLPFAQKRFCGAEGIDKVETVSVFRSSFATDYKLEMVDGPLKGLCSRVVLVLDEDNKILYSEQVPNIVDEPNYDAALAAASE